MLRNSMTSAGRKQRRGRCQGETKKGKAKFCSFVFKFYYHLADLLINQTKDFRPVLNDSKTDPVYTMPVAFENG